MYGDIEEDPQWKWKWNIQEILTKAFNNKDQKQGDLSKLGDASNPLKEFDSLEELISTLPEPNVLKTFKLFEGRHKIILPSVFLYEESDHLAPKNPYYLDNNKGNILDWKNAVFNGPFESGTWLIVEQQQADMPLFELLWNTDDPYQLCVYFYSQSDKKNRKHSVQLDGYSVCLFDETTQQPIERYEVNLDGSLGTRQR